MRGRIGGQKTWDHCGHQFLLSMGACGSAPAVQEEQPSQGEKLPSEIVFQKTQPSNGVWQHRHSFQRRVSAEAHRKKNSVDIGRRSAISDVNEGFVSEQLWAPELATQTIAELLSDLHLTSVLGSGGCAAVFEGRFPTLH